MVLEQPHVIFILPSLREVCQVNRTFAGEGGVALKICVHGDDIQLAVQLRENGVIGSVNNLCAEYTNGLVVIAFIGSFSCLGKKRSGWFI